MHRCISLLGMACAVSVRCIDNILLERKYLHKATTRFGKELMYLDIFRCFWKIVFWSTFTKN